MEWNAMGGLLLVFLRRLSLSFLVFFPPLSGRSILFRGLFLSVRHSRGLYDMMDG